MVLEPKSCKAETPIALSTIAKSSVAVPTFAKSFSISFSDNYIECPTTFDNRQLSLVEHGHNGWKPVSAVFFKSPSTPYNGPNAITLLLPPIPDFKYVFVHNLYDSRTSENDFGGLRCLSLKRNKKEAQKHPPTIC